MLQMKDYEPREALFEAVGMTYALTMLAKDENVKDALEDIREKLEWVLTNSNIYKNREGMNNE